MAGRTTVWACAAGVTSTSAAAHAGARAPEGRFRGARGDRRDGAVGQTQERVHARFRTADGVAGRARAQKSGEPADAHGLEGRGPGVFRQVGVSCLVMYFFRV